MVSLWIVFKHLNFGSGCPQCSRCFYLACYFYLVCHLLMGLLFGVISLSLFFLSLFSLDFLRQYIKIQASCWLHGNSIVVTNAQHYFMVAPLTHNITFSYSFTFHLGVFCLSFLLYILISLILLSGWISCLASGPSLPYSYKLFLLQILISPLIYSVCLAALNIPLWPRYWQLGFFLIILNRCLKHERWNSNIFLHN